MTPDHWHQIIAKSGNYTEAAKALGLHRDVLTAYAKGIRPTPRKVALACAAYLRGIKPMGEK